MYGYTGSHRTASLEEGAAMKAVVWNGPGQIDLEDVADARIEQPTDAVVRLTMSAICGTDLHMVRGTMPGCSPERCWGMRGWASWRRSARRSAVSGPVIVS